MVTHAIFSFLADDPVLSHLERLTERSALLLLAGAHRPQRDVTAERHQRPPARPATTPTAPALVLQSQRGEPSSHSSFRQPTSVHQIEDGSAMVFI